MVTNQSPSSWGPPPPGVRDPRIWRSRRKSDKATFVSDDIGDGQTGKWAHDERFTGFDTSFTIAGASMAWSWELVGCLLSIEDLDE